MEKMVALLNLPQIVKNAQAVAIVSACANATVISSSKIGIMTMPRRE